MNLFLFLSTVFCLISITCLIASYLLFKKSKEEAKRQLTLGATELIEQLLTGEALVVVEVMDRRQIIKWSPTRGLPD